MQCPTCQGTMRGKTVNTGKGPRQVFECNQDNGDCINDKGYPTSVWPKGNGARAPQQQRSAPPAQRSGNAMSKDDYWKRKEERDIERQPIIERSHAQEMALRFFALAGEKPDTKSLRAMTDWFQRDVGHVPAPPQRRQEPEPEPEPEPGYAPSGNPADDDEPPF